MGASEGRARLLRTERVVCARVVSVCVVLAVLLSRLRVAALVAVLVLVVGLRLCVCVRLAVVRAVLDVVLRLRAAHSSSYLSM